MFLTSPYVDVLDIGVNEVSCWNPRRSGIYLQLGQRDFGNIKLANYLGVWDRNGNTPRCRLINRFLGEILVPMSAYLGEDHLSGPSPAVDKQHSCNWNLAYFKSFNAGENDSKPRPISVGGLLIGYFSLSDSIVRSVGRYYTLLSCSFHFDPLQSGIVGVLDDEEQCQSVQNDRRNFQEKGLEFAALAFFLAGFWYIYSIDENEPIRNVLKILAGIILLVFGYVAEQAALNLVDFCRVDWRQLF